MRRAGGIITVTADAATGPIPVGFRDFRKFMLAGIFFGNILEPHGSYFCDTPISVG
jgi:hypothetical protein